MCECFFLGHTMSTDANPIAQRCGKMEEHRDYVDQCDGCPDNPEDGAAGYTAKDCEQKYTLATNAERYDDRLPPNCI